MRAFNHLLELTNLVIREVQGSVYDFNFNLYIEAPDNAFLTIFNINNIEWIDSNYSNPLHIILYVNEIELYRKERVNNMRGYLVNCTRVSEVAQVLEKRARSSELTSTPNYVWEHLSTNQQTPINGTTINNGTWNIFTTSNAGLGTSFSFFSSYGAYFRSNSSSNILNISIQTPFDGLAQDDTIGSGAIVTTNVNSGRSIFIVSRIGFSGQTTFEEDVLPWFTMNDVFIDIVNNTITDNQITSISQAVNLWNGLGWLDCSGFPATSGTFAAIDIIQLEQIIRDLLDLSSDDNSGIPNYKDRQYFVTPVVSNQGNWDFGQPYFTCDIIESPVTGNASVTIQAHAIDSVGPYPTGFNALLGTNSNFILQNIFTMSNMSGETVPLQPPAQLTQWNTVSVNNTGGAVARWWSGQITSSGRFFLSFTNGTGIVPNQEVVGLSCTYTVPIPT